MNRQEEKKSYISVSSLPNTPRRSARLNNVCTLQEIEQSSSAPCTPAKKLKVTNSLLDTGLKKANSCTKGQKIQFMIVSPQNESVMKEDRELTCYDKAFNMHLIYKHHSSTEVRLKEFIDTYKSELVEMEKNLKQTIKNKNQAVIHRNLLLQGHRISERNEVEDSEILRKTNTIMTTIARSEIDKEIDQLAVRKTKILERKIEANQFVSKRYGKPGAVDMSQSLQSAAESLMELGYQDSSEHSDVHSEQSPDDMKEWKERK